VHAPIPNRFCHATEVMNVHASLHNQSFSLNAKYFELEKNYILDRHHPNSFDEITDVAAKNK